MGAPWRNDEGVVVVVAVDASKEITDYALEWAVRNVIKAADTLVLLALLPSSNAGVQRNNHSGVHHFLTGLLKKWGLYHEKESSTHCISTERVDHVTQKIIDACVQMIKQLCLANHVKQVETHVKIITDAQMGSVAAEGEQLGAEWIILDRRLKKEGDFCLKQLTCNIILIDHAMPKILRLTNPRFQASEEFDHMGTNRRNGVKQMEKPPKSPIPARRSLDYQRQFQHLESPIQSNALVIGRRSFENTRKREGDKVITVSSASPPSSIPIDRTSSVRRAISLSSKHPPKPPPLCSVCKHNAPIFGKPPRKFSYREMEIATDRFSSTNFLDEGGYGPVYRGVLPDGQVVAVKQHKSVSAQGASEFCSEVEVLSCAQHRNLVMLVGYCMDKEWLLVYEFACNGSLDKHLYGEKSKKVMTWQNRLKVAIGAARGLRYLHEDCRVGCIVHRDLRPNNILLTHDFEPMVGDFGLARWQADGDSAEETRIVGTLGYLAPEYTRTGQITEKADVYAFGVLLMELISGLKAVDLSRSQGKQYLPDWGRRVLETKMICELIDPLLEGNYVAEEVDRMIYAASLCLTPDPKKRSRMSKVLSILEGDMFGDNMPQVSLQHAHTWPHTELAQSTPKRRPMGDDSTSKMNMISKSSKIIDADSGVEIQSNGRLITDLNQNLVSEDYQAHLQGSLAKFILKINMESSKDG